MKNISVIDIVATAPNSQRSMTPEGYLVAPGTLARTGIQHYRADELGLDKDGADPQRVLRLYRPPEEVFHADAMSSFERAPVTLDHPADGVDAANWKSHAVGDVHGLKREGDKLNGTLTIRDAHAIRQIQAGKVALSNGYQFDLDATPGSTPDGEAYDGVQRNIRGNHVALVDAARCGSDCRIADAAPLTAVIIDEASFQVSADVANAVSKLLLERDAARSEVAALRPDVMTPAARDAMVVEWSRLLADARRLVPGVRTEGQSCAAIRREVLTSLCDRDTAYRRVAHALLGSAAIAGADSNQLKGAFNAVVAVHDARALHQTQGYVAQVLAGALPESSASVLTGRDAYVARLQRRA